MVFINDTTFTKNYLTTHYFSVLKVCAENVCFNIPYNIDTLPPIQLCHFL